MQEDRLTLEELKDRILKYDFKTGSLRDCARRNGVHYNTIGKYVRLLGIEYNRHNCGVVRKRKPDNKHFDHHDVTTDPDDKHKDDSTVTNDKTIGPDDKHEDDATRLKQLLAMIKR